MNNYIYQKWQSDDKVTIYEIDCGNLNINYAIDVLHGIAKNLKVNNWANTFVTHYCNHSKRANFFAYAGTHRFYKQYNIDNPNYQLFNSFDPEFNFKPLAEYYKNYDKESPKLANDFYENWHKYQKEAIIKNIIE